jgi:hypothetical protein
MKATLSFQTADRPQSLHKALFSPWELSKEEQRNDWSKRPVSQSHVQYAVLDAADTLVLVGRAYRPDFSA